MPCVINGCLCGMRELCTRGPECCCECHAFDHLNGMQLARLTKVCIPRLPIEKMGGIHRNTFMGYLHDECYYDELDTMVQTSYASNKGGKSVQLLDTSMPPNLSSLAAQEGRVSLAVGWEYNPSLRKEPRVWDTSVTPAVARNVKSWTSTRAYPYVSTLAPVKKKNAAVKKKAHAKDKAPVKKASAKNNAAAKKAGSANKVFKKQAAPAKKAVPAKKKAVPAKKKGPKPTINKRPIKKRSSCSRAQS